MRSVTIIEKRCPTCGGDFEVTAARRRQECCSRTCAMRKPGRTIGGPKAKPRPVRTCEWCGVVFEQQKLHRGGTYCGKSCAGKSKRKSGVVVGEDGRARVQLRDNGKRQLYSRCLMEAAVGHHLTYDEVVHHINGDHTDDRIENLQLVSRSEHIKIHLPEMMALQGKTLCRVNVSNR